MPLPLPLAARLVVTGATLLAAGAVARGPARRPAPPAVRLPAIEDDALIARDGARLPLAAWLPPGEPEALLLGLHSFGDYRACFRLPGPWFAERGVAVYAYDQRGFGETEARGGWAGAEAMTRDVADAIRAIRARHGSRPPLYVIGESMGGAVALAALGLGTAAGIDGLVLAAPGVREGAPLRHAQDVGLWVGASTMPGVSFTMERGGRPWQHPEEAARLATDPLVVREVRVATWWGLVELSNLASDHAGAVTVPTLLIYGERDTTIHKTAIDRLAKRLRGPLTTIRYPTRHHLPLHERDPEEVFADILAWLDWRRGAAPAGRRLAAATPKRRGDPPPQPPPAKPGEGATRASGAGAGAP